MPSPNTNIDRRAYLKAAGVTGVAGLTSLAGCTLGGGGGGSDTITIGATVPLTGTFSSVGEDLKRGYELGVDRMKENEGVIGKDVELLLKDDESDAKKVRSNLQEMTSNNSVDMLWGSFSSLLVTAGSAFAEQQNIPFVGAAFAYMQPHIENEYEWTYAPMPKSRDVAASTKGLLDLISESDRPTNVGIWEPNSGWGNEQSQYWDDILSAAGYDIVLREKFSLGNNDFSSLISQSKAANVEILLSVPTPPGAITAMKQMKSNNFAPKVLQFVRGADSTAWWSALGQSGAYATMCPGWVPGLTGNGNAQMQEAYRSKYQIGENELLPVQVGTSYNVTQVAEQAFQAAGTMEKSAVQEALRTTTFNTVMATFGFEDNGLPTKGELTAPVGQWWEGGQHAVYPDVEGDAAIDFKYPLQLWGDR